MAQYLVLIYGDENAAAADPNLMDKMMAEHNAFGEKHGPALTGGNALHGTDMATSIRPTADGFAVTDGPFTETKEALGGYYMVEAADLDAAIAVAKDVPMPFGGVEVRPVVVFS
ncbi:MAG: YciI family protein [Mycobacteriales bacterium]